MLYLLYFKYILLLYLTLNELINEFHNQYCVATCI